MASIFLGFSNTIQRSALSWAGSCTGPYSDMSVVQSTGVVSFCVATLEETAHLHPTLAGIAKFNIHILRFRQEQVRECEVVTSRPSSPFLAKLVPRVLTHGSISQSAHQAEKLSRLNHRQSFGNRTSR